VHQLVGLVIVGWHAGAAERHRGRQPVASWTPVDPPRDVLVVDPPHRREHRAEHDEPGRAGEQREAGRALDDLDPDQEDHGERDRRSQDRRGGGAIQRR